MAAAAGVGGSSIDAFNSTVELRAAMQDEQQDRGFAQDLWAANQDKGLVMQDAVAGLDNNQYRASLDYRQWVDPHKQSTFAKIATLGVAAAATYFGGPKAGMAVVQASEGMAQAQNGNFEAAGQSYMGAMSSGMSAFKDTRSMGGNYWKKPSSGATLQI